jgi:flagellar hook-associated protein 2
VVDVMLMPGSGLTGIGGSGGNTLQGLLQQPQLLQNLLPGVNLQALAQLVQLSILEQEAPLQNLAQQQSALSQQSQAWSQIQSALSTVQQDLQTLSSPTIYTAMQAQSSNPSVVTATAGPGAQAGTYAVAVQSLMQPAVYDYTPAVSSASAPLGVSGTVDIGVYVNQNGTLVQQQLASFNFSATDTLQTLGQDITNATAGISQLSGLSWSVIPATINGTNGYTLVVQAPADFYIQITNTSGTENFSQVQSYQQAQYTVDGIPNQSPSNTVQNALGPDTTLTLTGVSAPGTSASVTVSQNPSAATGPLGQLVSDLQSALKTIAQLTGKGGVLEGQASLIGLGQQLTQMLTQVNQALPVGYQSLTDMGLSVSWSQSQGLQLSLNTSALTQAMQQNPQAVQQLLVGGPNGGGGIIGQLQQYLESFLAPGSGIIGSAQQGIANQEQMLTDQQQSLQQLVQLEQQSAEAQFMAALSSLLKEASLQQSLQAQFTAMGGGTGSGTPSQASSGG